MDFETSTYECFSEGLAHTDRIVRDTCLSYLKDQPVRTLEQTRCVLEGLEADGHQRFRYLHLLKGFPLDRDALGRVLELCIKWDAEGESLAVTRLLSWASLGAGHDIGAVVEFVGKAEGLDAGQLLVDLRERQAVWQLSLEEGIARLEALAAAMGDASEYPHAEIGKAEVIVDYLAKEHASARLEAVAEGWLQLEVDPSLGDTDCWKIGMAIDLCGKLKLASNLERILPLYELDYDWHDNLIVPAIRAFGSDDALLAIRERWESLSETQRLFLSDLFESSSLPGMEDFYRQQMDSDAMDYLENSRFAIGYANYGTSEALSTAQAYLEQHPENPELCVLAEFLYTHYRLRGVEGSIVESLGESIRAEEARIEEHQGFFSNLGALGARQPAPSLPLVEPHNGTMVRASDKVGRNDPCPCGSGKKYKKCCL